MEFSFDLISDLHVETWDKFNWSGQPTSSHCVVAGDVSRDRKFLAETLKHLGQCYQGVFYIDGNDEHTNYINDLGTSYRDLRRFVDRFKNVVFMQDNVVIINGVAVVAVNGWWTYDFDPDLDSEQSQQWFDQRYGANENTADIITNMAISDAQYLHNSIAKLQTHRDVKSIVVVSHTVPNPELVNHDIELVNTHRFNTIGNQHLMLALDQDTEHKIKTWCFGHYHRPVDREINGIRYINNCRGRGNTPWCQHAYFPKRISVQF